MIQIIADTLSCLSVKDASQLNIPLLPQMIIFGEEIYRDDTEIDTRTFLQRLKTAKELPKTAAPAPSLYHPIFRDILERGDTPFVICPTADLSGTYRSAVVAANEFPGAVIRVVDTRLLGAALGAVVGSAVAWAAAGLDPDAIEAQIMAMASRARTYFMVATLEYLHKGGRIGGAKAFLGSILQTKPILQLKDGRVEPAGSQRTQPKALRYMEQLVTEACPRTNSAHLSVMHGDAPEEAAELLGTLRNITGIQSIPLYDIPAAILVHGGPGAFGISFFVE